MKYIVAFTSVFALMIGYNVFLAQRDTQLNRVYDVCKQFTHHPDCPDSWKTKPAFSRH